MRLLIDGKEVEADDVRIVWDGEYTNPRLPPDRNDFYGYLQLNATSEGIVLDLYKEHTSDEHELVGTAWQLVSDLTEICH